METVDSIACKLVCKCVSIAVSRSPSMLRVDELRIL